ncbi:HAD family hydrolase [Celerinatantimonas sp. MCCC 1A17872]|uniref:HAD family hydrolase n=1 Tax=Celerinatantimonas sp. MCCC 1A17872 TaxID=3177514 RepID=UPI0038C5257A
MEKLPIKNVIFDIGNVMVRWSPEEIIRLTFGEDANITLMRADVFQSEVWINYNLGTVTQKQVEQSLIKQFNFSSDQMARLFYYLTTTQIQIFGQQQLLQRIKDAGYGVYALTDNVIEIVDYLKEKYDFWELFDGTVVSDDVHLLKPQPEIYRYLLDTYHLKAQECVFTDDLSRNIRGCEALGMHGIVFENSAQLEAQLHELGLEF